MREALPPTLGKSTRWLGDRVSKQLVSEYGMVCKLWVNGSVT